MDWSFMPTRHVVFIRDSIELRCSSNWVNALTMIKQRDRRVGSARLIYTLGII